MDNAERHPFTAVNTTFGEAGLQPYLPVALTYQERPVTVPSLGRRQTFFDDLRALMRYWCFASWGELLDFMLDGLEIEIPPDSS